MKLSSRQKQIIYGMILGDAYLQKTGQQNARLQIEHSQKQSEYMKWIYEELENIFQRTPKALERIHPRTKNTNRYLRLQSHASPWFGKLQRIFYGNEGEKKLPDNIESYLKSPVTLAVWYMDDGSYYQRDKSAHIYLQKYSENEIQRLIKA